MEPVRATTAEGSARVASSLRGGTADTEGEEAALNFEPEFDGAGDLLMKVVLTPFTVVYDICTSPIQAWMFG